MTVPRNSAGPDVVNKKCASPFYSPAWFTAALVPHRCRPGPGRNCPPTHTNIHRYSLTRTGVTRTHTHAHTYSFLRAYTRTCRRVRGPRVIRPEKCRCHARSGTDVERIIFSKKIGFHSVTAPRTPGSMEIKRTPCDNFIYLFIFFSREGRFPKTRHGPPHSGPKRRHRESASRHCLYATKIIYV